MDALLTTFRALIRPRRTFESLADGSKWVWVVCLAIIVVTTLLQLSSSIPFILEFQAEVMEAQQARFQGDPEEGPVDVDESELLESGEMDDVIETVTRVSTFVFGVLGSVIGLLVPAGFFLIFSKVWAKEAGFGLWLSVAGIAALPSAIRSLLQAVYTAATGLWVQHPGLSYLVATGDPLDPGGVGYALLGKVDVFVVWGLMLLYLGARYAGGFEKKRARLALGIWIGLGLVTTIVPAAVASMFAGLPA